MSAFVLAQMSAEKLDYSRYMFDQVQIPASSLIVNLSICLHN